MRKVFGPILIGLGAFLLVLAILAVTWMPGVVKRTPLDVNQTTNLSGTVKKLDTSTNELVENPVVVWNLTESMADNSSDEVAVWSTKTCVMIDQDDPPAAPTCLDGDDPRLVTASVDNFATDRVSALAVPDYPELPEGSVPHDGLVNKFPFDTEKTTYPYWDGTLEKAVDAVYEGTETILGVETYKFVAHSEDEPIQIAEGIDGTYTDTTTIYVEPKTGAIQQQEESQQRYLADGTQVLDLNVSFTDETMQSFADDAKTNIQMLNVLLVWLPIIGFVGGAICLIAGILLVLSARRRAQADGGAPADSEPQEPAAV